MAKIRDKFGASLRVIILGLASVVLLAACSEKVETQSEGPKNWVSTVSDLCGNTYKGRVTSQDPQDADWRKVDLTLGPIACHANGKIVLPLAVGEDTSRTWFLTPLENGQVEFRHQHILKNGEVDPVSDYGGYSQNLTKTEQGWRVDFPADTKTVAIFKENDLLVSTTNIWSFEWGRGKTLAYELNRENRHFRAVFDISQPK